MRVGKKAVTLATLASVMAFGTIAWPHHGGAIEWGEEARGPITGIATEFAFRFPHVQVLMDVADANGTTAQWTLVTRWTPTILRSHGWNRDSIAPGDRVRVTYLPHVSSPTVGSIVSIEVNGEPLEIDFSE
jgi:Family of unknown function (DUF6152)